MTVQVWTLGDAEVSRIEEAHGPMFDPASFFPDNDPARFAAQAHWLKPAHLADDGMLISSIHSWVIRLPAANGRMLNVLVDGCVGNHKDRDPHRAWSGLDSAWPARLAAAGLAPEQIDVVMCTHLHVDHVGWNTRLDGTRWLPTFPNARYLFSRTEVEHFRAERAKPKRDAFGAMGDKVWDDSILPVLDAGLVDLVDGLHPVVEGRLTIEPTPGHTPGSASLCLADERERALFTGDVLHHPIQVAHPHWNSAFCELPEQARATRLAILERLADSGALLMTAHFAAPFACTVARAGDGFGLHFVEPDRTLPVPNG